MKGKRRFFSALLLAAMLLSMLAGCTQSSAGNAGSSGNNENYKFVYEGDGLFLDSVNYHINIKGNNDEEKSFVLSVDEMPTAKLTGHWDYVDGKGYKFYFDDTENSFAYARYNAETKEFTLKYKLNLGGGQGRAKVVLTCKDEAFADVYDGEGLPPLPPTFSGHGWNGTNRHDCILYCYEDGTCVSVTDKAGTPNRYGTYTYDADANVYSFEFENEEANYAANYLGSDKDGNPVYRFDYCVFAGDDPSKGNFRANLPASEGFPDFTTSAWYFDESGNQIPFEFKTTFDEATQTYTLYYEAYSKGLQLRVVTYTIDD